VAQVAREYGAEVPFLRPEELSQNIPSLNPVLLHAAETLEQLDGFRADVVVSLLPVTPFRGAPVIDQAIETLFARGADLVITLVEERCRKFRRSRASLRGGLSGDVSGWSPVCLS